MHIASNAILDIHGRFDAYEAPAVQKWIDQQLKSGATLLLIDLSGATFIDSTALSVLVQGMKHCRQRAGDLVLCGMQQPVRIIFEITRLDQAFQIFSTRADVLAADWMPETTD